ncbi:Hypothetical predicted protein [Olea europaea subsp. europaea]|uniref:Uncharacterized protein n=1 Tax=Olea europaea subsp. europaea TaxID=158383 RepID=A0A8S0U6F7_OLEEU|nr:Hypothetical predicted protein [Olea europaea subsp. europaea]
MFFASVTLQYPCVLFYEKNSFASAKGKIMESAASFDTSNSDSWPFPKIFQALNSTIVFYAVQILNLYIGRASYSYENTKIGRASNLSQINYQKKWCSHVILVANVYSVHHYGFTLRN